MTVRLPAALNQYPTNAIVNFAKAVETSLVAEELASTDLTGGVVYQAPVDGGRAGESARWVTDADGNPVDLLLPGVTGRGGAAAVVGAGKCRTPAAAALRVCLVGHSYLDQETGTYTYNRPIEMLNGTVVWANVFLGRPFEIVKAHAIGGERLIDLNDRIDAAIAENPDVFVWNIGINDLKATVNSGSSRFTGKPYVVDPDQTNLSYCIEFAGRLLGKLAATGAAVIVLPETWPANGAGDQTKQLAARTLQYNDYLRWLTMTTRNMHYINLDRYTADPTSATGEMLSGYYGDFIHPSNLGAFKRAQVLANALKPLLPKINDRLPWTVLDTYTNLRIQGTSLSSQGNGTIRVMLPNEVSTNTLIRTGDDVALAIPSAGNTQWNGRWKCVAHSSTYIDLNCPVTGSYTGTVNVSTGRQVFDNPLFVTQTGGSFGGGGTLTSGTVPSGISVSCPTGSSCVFANSVAHTDLSGAADGLGNWLDVTITGGANATVTLFALSNRGPAVTGSPVYGRLFSGDTVQALFDVEVVSISGLDAMNFGLTGAFTHPTNGPQNLLIYSLYKDGVNPAPHPNQPFRGVVGTAEYQIPVGTLEALDGSVDIKFGAAGGTIRLRLGRVSVKALANPIRDVAKAFDI